MEENNFENSLQANAKKQGGNNNKLNIEKINNKSLPGSAGNHTNLSRIGMQGGN